MPSKQNFLNVKFSCKRTTLLLYMNLLNAENQHTLYTKHFTSQYLRVLEMGWMLGKFLESRDEFMWAKYQDGENSALQNFREVKIPGMKILQGKISFWRNFPLRNYRCRNYRRWSFLRHERNCLYLEEYKGKHILNTQWLNKPLSTALHLINDFLYCL